VKTLPYAAFLPLLRAGVAAAPERLDLKRQLAKTLFQTGRLAELVDWLQPHARDAGADPELQYYLGRAALANDDAALSLAPLRSAASQDFAEAFGYLAEALHELERPDDALAAALEGLERSPSDFKALGFVVRALLARGERARLWDLCSALRARGAWGAYVPSAMACAATTPEQEREVAAFVEPARWFAATRLAASPGFHAALGAELLAHPSRCALPSIKATTGSGSRIDQLQITAGPLARDVLARIATAVEAYAAQRQAQADHPLIAHRPASRALNSWAVVVHDDGHENWHMHPSGWISGVYYVAVPEIGSNAGESPGAIEFGPFPFGGTADDVPSWPRRRVTPHAGLLLLFPSYYAHRTWPTGVAEPRICIAFDVVYAAMPVEPG
jgi:uncharacterized protein (TIGR02466 family)